MVNTIIRQASEVLLIESAMLVSSSIEEGVLNRLLFASGLLFISSFLVKGEGPKPLGLLASLC